MTLMDEVLTELAQLRSEVADLKLGRVTYRMIEVTAADTDSGTIAGLVVGGDDSDEVTGIEWPAQFLPDVGSTVRVRVAGATPIAEPAGIAADAVTTRELDPAVVSMIESGGVSYFTQPTPPSYSGAADTAIWIDSSTAGGNHMSRWDGAAWQALPFGPAAFQAGAVTATVLAADAVNGKVITGATVQTAASGARVAMDLNGLRAFDVTGAAVTTISNATGKLTAKGATITGEINTAISGSRARIYQGADGQGVPMGVIALESGIVGDTAASMTAQPYVGGGGGMTLSGGAYTGFATKAAPKLVLQTDQANQSQAQLTAVDGFLVNGQPWAQDRVWNFLRSSFTTHASDSFSANAFTSVILGTLSNAPAGAYLLTCQASFFAAANSTSYMRIMLGGINVSQDMRVDRTTITSPASFSYGLNWGGGDLSAQMLLMCASATGTLYTSGSLITLVYLGPRS